MQACPSVQQLCLIVQECSLGVFSLYGRGSVGYGIISDNISRLVVIFPAPTTVFEWERFMNTAKTQLRSPRGHFSPRAFSLRSLATLSAVLMFGPALSHASADASDDALSVPRANFASADASEDGVLDSAEFKAFVNANADADYGKSKKIRRFSAYKRAFRKVDADKDGLISWLEFENSQSK